MQKDFTFRSLVALRKEDRIFELFNKRGQTLELFISFLYKTFDIHDRKQVLVEDFIVFLRRFLKDEDLFIQELGLEDLSPDSLFHQMRDCGLIEMSFNPSQVNPPEYVVVTNLYKDVTRFIEERTGQVWVGGKQHIGESMKRMMDNAALISGDKERRLQYLKEEINKLQAEVDEINTTGKVRVLSKEDIRVIVHNIDRDFSSYGTILYRSAMKFKDERDAVTGFIKQRIANNERVTTGEMVSGYSDTINNFFKSGIADTLQDAIRLLNNRQCTEQMDFIVETMCKNKDALEVMQEDNINLITRRKQTARYINDCMGQVNKIVGSIAAFMTANEVKQYRLLYEKANLLLAVCHTYGTNHSMRNRRFPFTTVGVSVVSPARKEVREPQKKLPVVNRVKETKPVIVQDTVFRNLADLNLPEKFRKLLDAHNGIFTLSDYMNDEGTVFGMYEFLAVKNIMSRYVNQKDALATGSVKVFTVTDFVPLYGSYKEERILSSDFMFNETGYVLWKKNSYKI